MRCTSPGPVAFLPASHGCTKSSERGPGTRHHPQDQVAKARDCPGTDQDRPYGKGRTPHGGQIFEKSKSFVVSRIGGRPPVELTTLIEVKALCRVVVDHDLWVVHELPALPSKLETHRHIVVDLSAGSAKPPVEPCAFYGRPPQAQVRTLENLHFSSRADADVVVPDHATEPLNSSHHARRSRHDGRPIVDHIASSDGPDSRVLGEATAYPCEPVVPRRGVVVSYGNDLALGRRERAIEGADQPTTGDGDDAEIQHGRGVGEDGLQATVFLPGQHQNFRRQFELLGERGKAFRQCGGTAKRWHCYGCRHAWCVSGIRLQPSESSSRYGWLRGRESGQNFE